MSRLAVTRDAYGQVLEGTVDGVPDAHMDLALDGFGPAANALGEIASSQSRHDLIPSPIDSCWPELSRWTAFRGLSGGWVAAGA